MYQMQYDTIRSESELLSKRADQIGPLLAELPNLERTQRHMAAIRLLTVLKSLSIR